VNAIAVVPADHDFRHSTDAAGLCGAIVKQTARNIQGRRYVAVEGWQAIAIAHGCAASALDVERVNDEGMSGFRCTGIVRRMSDGAEIARAEGFLGDDERTWSNRPVYARRAMVQTRAISRACRSAFAHVVVMIDAGLSTTPAEEVPEGGFVEGQFAEAPQRTQAGGHSEEREVSPQPAKQIMTGPHKSKTALETAIKGFVAKMDKITTEQAWMGLQAEYPGLLEQAENDHPDWWNGWDGMPDRFTPLSRRMEILEANLAEYAAGKAQHMADLARV